MVYISSVGEVKTLRRDTQDLCPKYTYVMYSYVGIVKHKEHTFGTRVLITVRRESSLLGSIRLNPKYYVSSIGTHKDVNRSIFFCTLQVIKIYIFRYNTPFLLSLKIYLPFLFESNVTLVL